MLELTSQTWRTAAEVDRPVWKHWLTIVKPLRTTSRTAILFIGGGSNDNPAPTTPDLRTMHGRVFSPSNQSILANRPRPRFSWTRAADGSIRVDVTDRPTSVNLWQATNPKARDFRLDVIGAAYTSTTLMEESPGVYVARVVKPAEGFTAFFVELIYDSGFRNPWKFTSGVSVVPDILPFKWEDAKAKYPPPGRP